MKSTKPKNLSAGIYQQVVGWSVHSNEEGILCPLYVDILGKIFYLDILTNLGFLPVSLHDNIYKDE